MSYKIIFPDKGDYIIMEVHGEMDRALGLHIAEQAQVLGDEQNIRNFLVDVTNAVNVDSILDQYRFANEDLIRSDELNHYSKIAVLASPDDHSHDFVETVVRNVGINFKLFRSRDQALSFLGIQSKEDHQTG